MKIFIARVPGAIAGQVVPQLVAGGHGAVGTTGSAAKTVARSAPRVEPVIIHAQGPDSVAGVVAKAEPNAPADAADGVAALWHLAEGVTP